MGDKPLFDVLPADQTKPKKFELSSKLHSPFWIFRTLEMPFYVHILVQHPIMIGSKT